MQNQRFGRMVAGALAAVLAPPWALASDWPQLWGPSVTAAVEDAVVGRPSLRELWRRPVGSGFSGISVAEGRGFTGESDGTRDHAIAFDLATGRTLWRATLGETYRGHDGSRDGPVATPAVGGGRVFMAGPRGTLVALDVRTGRELWRHDLVRELKAKLPFYGFGASPILAGEHVVLQVGDQERSGLVAFEAATGRVAWSAQPAEPKGDSVGYTMAAPAEIEGVRQLVATGHDRVFGVRAEDGAVLWSHALAEAEEPSRAPLPLPGGRVLVSRFVDTALVRVGREGASWTSAEVWRTPRLKGTYSPNVHEGGFVFGFSGQHLLCVDTASGETRWRQKTNPGTLIRVGRHLVVLGEQSGLLRVVEASPEAFHQVAEARVFNAGAQSSTGPSYADGRVFVRNVEEMVALALEDGRPMAEVRP